MTVVYEWDVEEVTTDEHNEVLQHFHQRNYADVRYFMRHNKPCEGTRLDVVLVRDDDHERTWAYMGDDGKLPEHFEDAYQRRATRVPKRFHAEVLAAIAIDTPANKP